MYKFILKLCLAEQLERNMYTIFQYQYTQINRKDIFRKVKKH